MNYIIYKALKSKNMKFNYGSIKIFILSFIYTFILFAGNILAQSPPHPGEGGPGTGDVTVGGGSPLGGGLLIMLFLGVGYGMRKLYEIRSKSLNEV